MSTLEAMEKEAASLPAAVPETEGLTALIQKAEEWKAKAAALAAQKAPLKRMREVLHLGLRMPVEVPQVESLRAEIRRREWEETAKKVVLAVANVMHEGAQCQALADICQMVCCLHGSVNKAWLVVCLPADLHGEVHQPHLQTQHCGALMEVLSMPCKTQPVYCHLLTAARLTTDCEISLCTSSAVVWAGLSQPLGT